MIHVPKLMLPQLCNQKFNYFGIDCISLSTDSQVYNQWPEIEYKYNSRGFRDNEWPQKLDSAIWCIGDSFTLGLGSDFLHTWPQRLNHHSQHRVINVSMDGASNEWISRTVCDVYDLARPDNIVIMWSYFHRREHPNVEWPDLHRRQHYAKSTVTEDYKNFDTCRKLVHAHCADSNLIEFVIPGFVYSINNLDWQTIRDTSWPETMPTSLDQFLELDSKIITELQTQHNVDVNLLVLQYTLGPKILAGVIRVEYLDLARDGKHFDLITADWVAKQALPCLRL